MRKLIPFMMSLAIVAGCSDDNDPITPAGSITVAAGQQNATLAAGGSITIPISVSRTGSFAGAINLTAENLPTGVTASFDPASVPNGTTTSQMTLTAAANAAASSADEITIRASGSGVTSATTTVNLTVTATGINLVSGVTTATITQGATASIPISFTRVGAFTGAVTVDVEDLPAGVTATVTPATIGAGQTVGTITLTATNAATVGTSDITIRGTGTGIEDATQEIELTVNAATTSGLGFTASPAAVVVQAGQTVQTTVAVARTGGFTGDVTFTLENAPAGMTITVDPTTVTGNTATVTIATTAAVTPGVYQVRLRGTSGTTNSTVALTVIVTS